VKALHSDSHRLVEEPQDRFDSVRGDFAAKFL
jgi:hypothetical protein